MISHENCYKVYHFPKVRLSPEPSLPAPEVTKKRGVIEAYFLGIKRSFLYIHIPVSIARASASDQLYSYQMVLPRLLQLRTNVCSRAKGFP